MVHDRAGHDLERLRRIDAQAVAPPGLDGRRSLLHLVPSRLRDVGQVTGSSLQPATMLRQVIKAE